MQVHRAFKSNLVMIYLTSCKLTYATMLELMLKSLDCRRQLHAACLPVYRAPATLIGESALVTASLSTFLVHHNVAHLYMYRCSMQNVGVLDQTGKLPM